MISLAAAYGKISLRLKRLPPHTIVFTASLLCALVIILATLLARADSVSDNGSTVRRNLPPAVLIAATNAGARAFTAVGERAKRINASLPFDRSPIEAARPFVIGVEEGNYSRALLCLRAAIYHEAGFEPLPGRQAVAQVILNRVRHAAFPKSVCDVVYQGAASPVCQFSFACDEARHRRVAANAWREAEKVAAEALAGHVEPSVGTSTHYHAVYVAPRWAPLLSKVSQTGTHIFYRWPGAWGRRRAFSGQYAGEQASAPGRTVELEAAIRGALETESVRGVALVEIKDGKISPEAVGGVDHRGASVRPGDLWDVGSNERLITATLIARLVDKKLLSWDAPLRQLFPDLAPYMQPALQSVTLVQLLSERSILTGLNEPAFESDLADGAHPLIVQRAAYIEKALNPAGPQKKANSVSNPGLVLAAAAVEGVTGRSYEDLLREEIFKPLEMRSARFTEIPKRRLKPAEKRTAGSPYWLSQAGKMHMSLRDFSTFLIDQQRGELGKGKLLSTVSYRRLHKPPDEAQEKLDKHEAWHIEPFSNTLMRGNLGHFWVAGIKTRGNGPTTLLVVGVPHGRSGLGTLALALNTDRRR